jgi:hypothetical protein
VRASVKLLDEDGVTREEFDVGETIYIAAQGLKPATVYQLVMDGDQKEGLSLASLTADRHGSIPLTALLPYFGLLDPKYVAKGGFPKHEEAVERYGGRGFSVSLHSRDGKLVAATKFRVSKLGRRPQVYPCDKEGRLRTGVMVGKEDVAVVLRNFPKGCVRVYMVPRQFDWQPGDPIEPVRDANGAPLMIRARVEDSTQVVVPLWSRDRVRTGSYQFVARVYRPGWYDADEMVLHTDDVVSSRRMTSLVVRKDMFLVKAVWMGCVLAPEVAGRPLVSTPYFEFVNNFPVGTDVYAALDPEGLPPGLVGQKAAIYVVPHKTQAEWAISNLLNDVSGPGLTPAVETVSIVPGCINWNMTLVWPNPQTPGKYDIVVDFGNNDPDPAQFATDGAFDSPLDMIDGYFRVGFYVTEDPSLTGPYIGGIGRHEYNMGSVPVPSTDSGPTPTQSLQLKAVVRYPSQYSGVEAPFIAGESYPLVVMVHGNSGMESSYLGYNYLLDHLASHGFIAMSIYAPVNSMIETRARAVFEHLNIMSDKNDAPGLFNGHIDFTNVGIMGHSRGGEAVIRAGKINADEGLGWDIKAGIAVAPTDFYHYGDPGIPVLVIYGSNDGDVAGWWGAPPSSSFTGFDIYDEAGTPRSFVFVYGATHDRFNTEWTNTESNTELRFPSGSDVSAWGSIHTSDLAKLITPQQHQDVVKGYATAFYQMHLKGKSEQIEYFTGELKPSLVSSVEIHTSHQEPGGRLADDFEQTPHDPTTNTLGGSVVGTSLLYPQSEDELRTLDSHSPHQTAGAMVAWNTTTGVYLNAVPSAYKDVSGYKALSFRVTQRYGSAQNPANQLQDLYVRLTDGSGNTRAVKAGYFTDIPYPYERGVTHLIKSAMKTVRIPLLSYTIEVAGADILDLKDIQSVSFEFFAKPTGEIEIDEIEFTY